MQINAERPGDRGGYFDTDHRTHSRDWRMTRHLTRALTVHYKNLKGAQHQGHTEEEAGVGSQFTLSEGPASERGKPGQSFVISDLSGTSSQGKVRGMVKKKIGLELFKRTTTGGTRQGGP